MRTNIQLSRGSMVYRILLDAMPYSMHSHKSKWEIDCQSSFDQMQWDTIHSSLVTAKNIVPLCLQSIKLVTHWYITPEWLGQIGRLQSTECWKGCGHSEGYMHCWWKCQLLQPFWKTICQAILEMTDCELELSPKDMLLHIWTSDKVPSDKKHIVSLLLVLAKTEIVAHWKVATPPNLNNWNDRIRETFLLSKITDKILSSTNPTYTSRLEHDWFCVLCII